MAKKKKDWMCHGAIFMKQKRIRGSNEMNMVGYTSDLVRKIEKQIPFSVLIDIVLLSHEEYCAFMIPDIYRSATER